MTIAVPPLQTVDEFLAWSERQERGRFELQDGRIIKQQSQNWGQLRLKNRLFRLLEESTTAADLPYFAAPDGATVRINARTAFEPDALVAPLPFPADTDLEIPNPVIVVEVLSPSSVKRELTDKVAGYFSLASVRHYLVLDPEEKAVILHRRPAGGGIAPPALMTDGVLVLDPTGIEVRVADIFARP